MISHEARTLLHELDRVVRDLRRAGGVVQRPGRHPDDVGETAHAVAQVLADATADANDEPRRHVPRIGDQAVADQIAVVGRELLEAVTVERPVDIDGVRQTVGALRGLMLRAARR